MTTQNTKKNQKSKTQETKMIRVRIVSSALKYANTVGGNWFVVKRENVLGLEDEKHTMRIREPLNGEKSGDFWDAPLEEVTS